MVCTKSFYQHAISSFISQGDDVLLLHAHCTQKKIVTRSYYYLMQCLQNWVLIVVTLVLGISFLSTCMCVRIAKVKFLSNIEWQFLLNCFQLVGNISIRILRAELKQKVNLIVGKRYILFLVWKKIYITYEETVKNQIKYIILSI